MNRPWHPSCSGGWRMSRKSSAGFTLLELIFVTAVIGLLSAIAVPTVFRSRMAANETSAFSTHSKRAHGTADVCADVRVRQLRVAVSGPWKPGRRRVSAHGPDDGRDTAEEWLQLHSSARPSRRRAASPTATARRPHWTTTSARSHGHWRHRLARVRQQSGARDLAGHHWASPRSSRSPPAERSRRWRTNSGELTARHAFPPSIMQRPAASPSTPVGQGRRAFLTGRRNEQSRSHGSADIHSPRTPRFHVRRCTFTTVCSLIRRTSARARSTQSVSCQQVLTSEYGSVLGVPVAAGGAIWSLLAFMLAAFGLKDPKSETASRVVRVLLRARDAWSRQRLLLRVHLVLRLEDGVSDLHDDVRERDRDVLDLGDVGRTDRRVAVAAWS